MILNNNDFSRKNKKNKILAEIKIDIFYKIVMGCIYL